MRTRSRVGAATAAVALASVAALAGAGGAVAADPPPVIFDSDSALDVGWVDGEIEASYDNRSGTDLECILILGENDVIDAASALLRAADSLGIDFEPDGSPAELAWTGAEATELFEDFYELFLDAALDGRAGRAVFTVSADESGPVELAYPSPEDEVTDPETELAGASVCATVDGMYVEVETSYFVPAAPGSLGAIVGSATGSLGSLGS